MNVNTLKHTAGAARTTRALIAVGEERARQEELKAEGRFAYTAADPALDEHKLAMLTEEVGEVAREILALAGIVQESATRAKLRRELIQVAAIAVAWVEALEWNGWTSP